MRIALISDVHGNLPALEAALEELEAEGPDAVFHLGDLVGYAPWPDEVVRLLHGQGIPGVSGNYDSTVAVGHDECGCRYENPLQAKLGRRSFAWTRERVGEETRRLLRALPFRFDLRPGGGHGPGPRIVLVHGTPFRNTVYWTEDRRPTFFRRMAALAGLGAGDAICFGHTHRPFVRELDGITFVNAGSVGKPGDGDPRGSYALVRVDEGEVRAEIRRFPYDVEAAVRGIRESGLPDALGELLRTGGRPEAAPGPGAV